MVLQRDLGAHAAIFQRAQANLFVNTILARVRRQSPACLRAIDSRSTLALVLKLSHNFCVGRTGVCQFNAS